MSRNRRLAGSALALMSALALAATSTALASGGPGGGGTSGGGACVPLTMPVTVGHSDAGFPAIGIQATIRNCTNGPQPMLLTISSPGSPGSPGSPRPPYTLSTGGASLKPGQSLTVFPAVLGSIVPGARYTITGVLTATATSPPTVLSTITTTVTAPAPAGG